MFKELLFIMRYIKNRYLLLIDMLLSALSYIATVALIHPISNFRENFLEGIWFALGTAVLYCISRYLFGIYRIFWATLSSKEALRCILVHLPVLAVSITVGNFLLTEHPLKTGITMNIMMIGAVMAFRLLLIFCYKARHSFEKKTDPRVIVIGAGSLGTMLVKDIIENRNLNYYVVGYVDDNPDLYKHFIYGKQVLGPCKDIPKICMEKDIQNVIFAISSATFAEKAKILDICSNAHLNVKIVPSVDQTLTGEEMIKGIRDVEIEDLLDREPIKLDNVSISNDLRGQVVMVTGGGGSIGSELCRQIIKYKPERLILVDIYENTTYVLQQELEEKYPDQKLDVLIASVRDKARMSEIFERFHPAYVFHAAAHKHVPLMEFSPCEAIKNNVFGTYNMVELSERYGVKRFVQISTDKAVNPTNVMGASKRMCEMIIQAFSKKSKTQFVAVRFGNVLGSNGSVVPRFKKQIAEGGPVTVTHKDITRFFMTIPEAAQLVLQAAAYAHGGEIFVLDMGKPVRIYDMAEKMIRLSGFRPNVDIPIKITGLRAGEKLYEELLMNEEGLEKTAHSKIFIGKLIDISRSELQDKLDTLEAALHKSNEDVKEAFMATVPTYHPPVHQ